MYNHKNTKIYVHIEERVRDMTVFYVQTLSKRLRDFSIHFPIVLRSSFVFLSCFIFVLLVFCVFVCVCVCLFVCSSHCSVVAWYFMRRKAISFISHKYNFWMQRQTITTTTRGKNHSLHSRVLWHVYGKYYYIHANVYLRCIWYCSHQCFWFENRCFSYLKYWSYWKYESLLDFPEAIANRALSVVISHANCEKKRMWKISNIDIGFFDDVVCITSLWYTPTTYIWPLFIQWKWYCLHRKK